MISYLDTSAALKLLIEEPESAALAQTLDDRTGDRLVASMLLFTEVHCAAHRRVQLAPEAVNAVLDAIDVFDVIRDDLVRAGTSGWGLRSADAIHLAAALRIGADELITYDSELAAAARLAGLEVSQPGR